MSTFHARVDAAQFHEALGNVLRFSAKRSSLPILAEANVCLQNGRCVLTCTNLNQWCIAAIPASGDSFSFVFAGTQKIFTACKYFSGELELTYTVEPTKTNPDPSGQISISDGKRSLARSTERSSDFPELMEKPMDRHYSVDAKKLLERFKRVKYAISMDTARPNRCCVEFLKDKIITVDGYRLAMSTDPSLNAEKPFYIPPEVMAELQMFKDQTCTISVGTEWAAFESKSLRVVTRMPGYDGFDVEKVIPTSFGTEYPVDVDRLLDEVKYLRNIGIRPSAKAYQYLTFALTQLQQGTPFRESIWELTAIHFDQPCKNVLACVRRELSRSFAEDPARFASCIREDALKSPPSTSEFLRLSFRIIGQYPKREVKSL